jgi:hypothetical protein
VCADPDEGTKYVQVLRTKTSLLCEVSDSGEYEGDFLDESQIAILASMGFVKGGNNYQALVTVSDLPGAANGDQFGTVDELAVSELNQMVMTAAELSELLGRGLSEVHEVLPDTELEITLV